MRTTININDQLIKETEALYKADSRSKSIEYALRDALRIKRLEQLREMVGKVDFDTDAIAEFRDSER